MAVDCCKDLDVLEVASGGGRDLINLRGNGTGTLIGDVIMFEKGAVGARKKS